MIAVLTVFHIILIIALVGSVLIQRSEGGMGGLGGGGGAGGMGGFLSGRAQANLLTRTTAILACLFFINSLALAYLGSRHGQGQILVPDSPIVAPVTAPETPSQPTAPTGQ